ncbi:hypothetical protein LOD99_1458 [Oopsacas minuta]|uniref:ISXO2-like transposase domain-containing protein n=1 Tax=Oopsacas minuta TaxID=111878 RepID=A0AAV7K647_9METZ|nr:hypothetical protein LOD99_1458 [Oopsacas minuta]
MAVASLTFTPMLMPIIFPDIGVVPLKRFYQSIVTDQDAVIRWLQENGLLARGIVCKCGRLMKIGKFSHAAEELGWRCMEKACRKVASLRVGSFFESSNQKLIELIEFIFLWSKDYQTTETFEENLGWSKSTITDWKNYMRDICVTRYLSYLEHIGGPGEIVEIDESKFGHHKHSRGRLLSGQWVFGGVCRGTSDMFMIPVADRSASTLIPLVNEFIRPGSIIMSDKWASYNQIHPEHFLIIQLIIAKILWTQQQARIRKPLNRLGGFLKKEAEI